MLVIVFQIRFYSTEFFAFTASKFQSFFRGAHHASLPCLRLGRKMGSEYFEVLEGLKPGDRVITSSYENFGTNEVLILK